MARMDGRKHRLERRRLLWGLAGLPLLGILDERAMAGTLPYHHTPKGFRNPPGSPAPGGSAVDWARFAWRRLAQAQPRVALPADHVLPPARVQAGIAGLGGRDGVTWLGHAAFLLHLGGKRVLTDPFLSDYASPFPPHGPKRYAPPGLRAGELPPIDLVLLSHNHYDHLDLPSLEAIPGRERASLVTTLKVSGYLGERGFGKVIELDWHQRAQTAGFEVTALPAIHFSKRGLFDRDASLWCGFMLESPARRIYFAGDTGYGPVFPELGGRYPAPELALVPIGAYAPEPMMESHHCNPEDAVRLGRDLGARALCGMHWGAIRLTDEPVLEPPARFRAAASAAGYPEERAWVLKVGETRAL